MWDKKCRHHPKKNVRFTGASASAGFRFSRGWKGWQNLINEREVGDQWLDEADGRRSALRVFLFARHQLPQWLDGLYMFKMENPFKIDDYILWMERILHQAGNYWEL